METIARRVGRYEIQRVIGRGGMATVDLAHQVELDREVALEELALFEGRIRAPRRGSCARRASRAR